MLKEFKEFAMKGPVIELAVGVIIGAAFGKIVSSLVDDIIMPPVGRMLGNVDFANLFVICRTKTIPASQQRKRREPRRSITAFFLTPYSIF